MLDENYHIVDIDEYNGDFDNNVKTQIIYESSDNMDDNMSSNKYARNNINLDSSDDISDSYRGYDNNKSKYKIDVSNELTRYYHKKPNTFIGTLVGLIFAICTLLIGFWKTLFLFIIILIANIIGQLLDKNSRIIMFFDWIIRKFKRNRFSNWR